MRFTKKGEYPHIGSLVYAICILFKLEARHKADYRGRIAGVKEMQFYLRLRFFRHLSGKA